MRRTEQLTLVLLCACSSSPTPLTTAQLMDPQACVSCHPTHVAAWSGSMHAYASDDPVFTAMNARFQREVGASGDPTFCVKCHAPLALQAGATTDGTNMASVDAKLHGITCFFCHTAASIQDTHDNGIVSSGDGIMRGPISDPAGGASHESQYSAMHDLNDPTSSSLCGSCHDVRNGHGVDVERTFQEWQGSLYAQNIPSVAETCSACHMTSSVGVAATTNGAPQRRVHDHSLAAFDVALGSFSSTDADQRNLVQQTLDASIIAKLCVAQPSGSPNVSVTLDNAFVGHEFPSGAAHDRRVWVELHAFANGTDVLSSGVDVSDPSAWVLRDQLTDAAQQPVLFLWEAFATSRATLPPAVTNVATDPKFVHSVTRTFLPPPETDRVTMVVHATPIGVDVLNALVTSGDLDASLLAKMPTFDLQGTAHEWDKANGYGCAP